VLILIKGKGWTPAHYAAIIGLTTTLKALKDAGADMDAMDWVCFIIFFITIAFILILK
jgi:hypothetical protein